MIVGRKTELALIDSKLQKTGYELGVIYGQRRIGKTSIILEAVRPYRCLYFLSREDSYQGNLRYFSEEYRKFIGAPFAFDFPSFDSLFDAILETNKDEKLVIVIDELPFLAKSYPGFISYLQGFCDKCKMEGKNIKILLSGSNMSFMLNLLENKAKPLYQRATFKLLVKPMVFSEAIMMLSSSSPLDKARYLSIFGARPYYLDKIDQAKSFEENLLDLCFNSLSILVDAPNVTLPLGFSNNSTYVSIMLALSSGKKSVKEIADALKIEPNALSMYLKRMADASSIERRMAFNGNKKTVYYEISDPFIRFYYKLIYPNLPDIERGLGEGVYKAHLSAIEESINHGFEDVTIAYMEERNARGLLPNLFHAFKNYKADNSKLGRSVGIDLISDSLDEKTLIAGEAKFKNKDISLEELLHLKESVSIFKERYKNVYYFMFSRKSFARNLADLHDPHVELVSLNKMMSDPF